MGSKKKNQKKHQQGKSTNNIATFLVLDETTASINSANVLNKENRFGDNEKNHIINFSKEAHPFKNIERPEDLSTIVCVGHSVEENGKVIRAGKFTPRDFADKFNSQFDNKFDKSKKVLVQDLYLICCEAGLSNSGSNLAKQISVELVARGFEKVRVHAIKPNDSNVKAMIVTIVEQGCRVEPGSLRVRVFNDEEYERFKDFEIQVAAGEIDTLDERRVNFMNKLKPLYWNRTDVKAIYDEPANTIKPVVKDAKSEIANPAPAAVNRAPATENNNDNSKQSETTTPITLEVTVGALMAYARQLRKEAANPFSCFLFLMSERKNNKAEELNAIAESLKTLNSDASPAAIKNHVTTAIIGKTNTLYKQGLFGISIGKCRTKKLIESIEDGTLNKYIADSRLKITDKDKSLKRNENLEESFKKKTTAFKKN